MGLQISDFRVQGRDSRRSKMAECRNAHWDPASGTLETLSAGYVDAVSGPDL